MAEHASIEDAIDAIARGGVKKTKEGDRELELLALKELMEADALRAAKVAATQKHFGLRMTKLISPGAG